jgi:hypothetical protein
MFIAPYVVEWVDIQPYVKSISAVFGGYSVADKGYQILVNWREND